MTLLDRFITLAQRRPNIVAIGTEGASNNAAVAADAWTDLDITLFATAPEAEAGEWWLAQFGEPTLVQHLENRGLFAPSTALWHTWLARFPGTQRIDLKITAASELAAYEPSNSLNAIQWTRAAGRLTPRPTSAASHWVSLPTQAEFSAELSEFYWCAGNVCKGLARQNLLYANEQFNQFCRPALLRLLAWRATAQQAGHFDAGVTSKFLAPTLSVAEQRQLADTYQQGTLAATRASLQAALVLHAAVLPGTAALLGLAAPDLQAARRQLTDWLSA